MHQSRAKEHDVYFGPIAGVAYGAFKLRPDRLLNLELYLVREPENEYDSQAIALFAVHGIAARKVGYIPRKQTGPLHAAYADGRRLKARCVEVREPSLGFGRNLHLPIVRVWYEGEPPRPSDTTPLRPPGARRLILS